MGIFQEMVAVVNRAPIDISVTFDGQALRIKPGRTFIPNICVPNGKNQNPVMGSVDHTNPHMSGGQYLLAVEGEDDCTPLTPEEWQAHLSAPSRFNEQVAFAEKYGGDPKARLVVMGKGRKVSANSRAEVADNPRGNAAFAGEK
jgi:hypothetical protein